MHYLQDWGGPMLSEGVLLFSGLGIAAYPSQDVTFLYDSLDGTSVVAREGDLSMFADLDPFFTHLPLTTPLTAVKDALLVEQRKRDSIFFTLSTIDKLLDADTRQEAAALVDSYVSEEACATYLKAVLSSLLLPNGYSLLPTFEGLTRWNVLATEINSLQVPLRRLEKAWDHFQKTFSPDWGSDLSEMRASLISSGATVAFAKAIQKQDLPSFNQALVAFSLDPAHRAAFPDAAKLLTLFRRTLEDHGNFGAHALQLFAQERVEISAEQEGSWFSEPSAGHEIFEQVKRQIEGIKKILWTGNRQNLDRAVNELIIFQEEAGHREYLSKTLCNLASIAVEYNEPHLADSLSQKAIDLGWDDVVVYNTRANVLKNLGRFNEAIQGYEDSLLRFGNDRYTLCGYADTLFNANEIERSRQTYLSVIELFPDNPVAPNGLAGVYQAEGNVERALALSSKTANRFKNEVSRMVYAGILRASGSYQQSIAQLELIIKMFPQNVRAWSSYIRTLSIAGRKVQALERSRDFRDLHPEHPSAILAYAEALMRTNNLDASIKEYASALRQFPCHRPAQIGKASVLILMDRSLQAEEILAGLELASEIDWYAYHALCIALLKRGAIPDAIKRLEESLTVVPWRNVRAAMKRTLGFAFLRNTEPAKAVPVLQEALTNAEPTQRGGLLLFMSSALLAIGKGRKSAEMWKVAESLTTGTEMQSFAKRTGGKGFLGSTGPLTPLVAFETYGMLLAA